MGIQWGPSKTLLGSLGFAYLYFNDTAILLKVPNQITFV